MTWGASWRVLKGDLPECSAGLGVECGTNMALRESYIGCGISHTCAALHCYIAWHSAAGVETAMDCLVL